MKISTKNSDSNIRFGFKGKLLSVLFLVTMLLGAIQTQAQFDIVSTATNYTENFNALASTGTGNAWSNNSTLTGWYARTDATASITTYNANTGSTTTAALNSFGVAGTNPVTERALGYSPTNAFFGASGTGKGYIGWRLRNNTGGTISSIQVTWTGEQWRRDNTVAQSLSLTYRQAASVTDLTTGTYVATGSTFTALQLGTATLLDGNAPANRTSGITVTITVNIPAGEEIMLRWEDLNDSGNDHQLAIDDVTINAAAAASSPTVTTTIATSITNTSAVSGGDVTTDGGATVTGRGVAYGTSPVPTISGTITNDGGGTGVYVSNLTSLSVNTQYFYRAYATNAGGTAYGAESNFYTLANTPTQPVLSVPTSSTLNITLGAADGNPSATQYAIRETGSGDYVQADGTRAAGEVWQTASTWAGTTITGLTASTTYNFEVKARNGANVETGFGTVGSGTTSAAGAQNQTITFGPLSNVTYGVAPFALTATASSNLTVSYQSSNTNVATISGSTITIVGAGSTNITASQAGDVNWNPAPDVIQPLTVDPKELTVTGAVAQDKTYDGNTNAAIDLTGATLNGIVGSDNVTVSGAGSFATANAGTGIAVTAALTLGGSEAGNYFLTQPSGLSANINQAPQTITFNALPSKTTADAPFALTATASSGLTVSYSSSNPAVADVAGNIVTIFSAGSTIITASQAGDANFLPATNVDQVQLVTQAPSVVTYSFGTTPGTAAPTAGTPVANLSFSNFGQGNNNGTTTLLSGTSASSGYAGASGNINAAAAAFAAPLNTATSTYFEFTLTPAPAHQVTLSSLSFGSRSTGTGPAAYTVRSSIDGYTSDVATGSTPNNSTWGLRSPSVTSTMSAFGQPITFRIFGHSGTGTPATGTANWRVDDVSVGVFVNAAPDCDGPPVAGTISGQTTSCGTGSATLSLTGNSDINAAAGLSIQWYSSIDNNTFNPVGVGNETSFPTGTLTQTTYYYAIITCAPSGLTAQTNTVEMTVNQIPAAPTVSIAQPGCGSPTGTITITAPTGAGYTYSIGGAYQPEVEFAGLASGNYNVTAQLNGCTSPITVATVDPQPVIPGTPGPVSGISNVCPYIGTGTPLVYSVDPVAGATGYQWTVPPTVSIISGNNTNSITVNINNGFIANANKLIRVRSTSVCGISNERLFYLLAQLPTTPAPIVASNNNVCSVIGTVSTITYTIPKVAAATSYIWSAQAGTTVISHPEGLGVNDTTITVSFTNGFTTSAITVQAVNDCGTSGTRSISVVRSNPSTPGLISGPTNACAHIAPGGTVAAYSVPAVAGVTYTWTVPAGVVDLSGQGTNSITFTYPAGFTNGSVSVVASNGCGNSGIRSLAVSKLNPATPGGIDVIQVNPCPNRQYSYTIAAMPANATSIQWTVPVGGTIESGQGTTSILVSYVGTVINGTVSATAVSNCANSLARTVAVKLAACEETPPPPPPFARGNAGVSTDISATVNVYPNPTTANFNLQVITAGKEQVVARVLDMQGRQISRMIVLPYQSKTFGAELKSGAYILEVTQGCKRVSQKLMKL